MVHPGKTQVFKGQGAQAVQGFGHRQTTPAHFFQQLFQNFYIHPEILCFKVQGSKFKVEAVLKSS